MTTADLRTARTADRMFAALRWVQVTQYQDPNAIDAYDEAKRDFDNANKED